MATTTSPPNRGRKTPLPTGRIPDGRTIRGNSGRGRPRSRSLVLLAALLVLGFALATAYVVTRAGDQVSVIGAGTPIAKGHAIERADLVSLSVSGVPGAVPVQRADDIVGETATVDMVKGQVLTEAMLTAAPTPASGQSTVGLALDPTRVPSSGLDAGDRVDVVAVPASQTGLSDRSGSLDHPTVLAKAATVYTVQGLATDGGKVLLTVVVDTRVASRVAAYSTSDRVAVVEVAAGGGQ